MNRSRTFTLVAALVLSLGIGTTTALFSIVNALFFTPPLVRLCQIAKSIRVSRLI
jgi:hypothetical protein